MSKDYYYDKIIPMFLIKLQNFVVKKSKTMGVGFQGESKFWDIDIIVIFMRV